MRGVPGSGKSTAAKFLGNIYAEGRWVSPYVGVSESGEEIVHIHSTDSYFMVDGVYKYNPALIGKNHSKNYKAFRDSVDLGIPLVIVDNTNTTRREWNKYQNYAEGAGYWVSFHVMPHPTVSEAKERNTHNVPGDVIKKMIQRFE
jgi:tRNA uridine 5-carbamoylmethylation protein Kti12